MAKRKKKKSGNIKIVFILLFLIIIGAILFYLINKEVFLSKINYDMSGNITYYDRYGIHINFKGDFKLDNGYSNPILVLSNGIDEFTIDWNIQNNGNDYSFETSKYINDGINLEKLKNGTYYLLVKVDSAEENEYFPLINKTNYNDITYYSLTKNGSNQKIDIAWDRYEGHELLGFHISTTTLPDDVYDITIDPGHDGNDSGMIVCVDGSVPNNQGECYGSTAYKESDINFTVAAALKDELEKMGFKVKLTRDSKDDTVPTYGDMGSGTAANATKSKFNLALHHNSTNVHGGMANTHGLEVYVAGDSKFDLAKLFVENICEYGKTDVSTKKEFKVEDGIYQRFSDDGITPYYYMIREVGGIATHAYVDGSNTDYNENPYYDSNDTAESYLMELGYIDNVRELENILDNPKGYAKGIALSIEEYLK